MKSFSFSAEVVWGTTHRTANTEFAIAHNLGRVPLEAFMVDRDKAGSTYRGPTTWTATEIFLRSDITSMGIMLLVI